MDEITIKMKRIEDIIQNRITFEDIPNFLQKCVRGFKKWVLTVREIYK